MFRLNRAFFALAFAVALLVGASAAFAQAAAGAQATPPAKTPWINPLRGTAEIQYIGPVTKPEKDEVVTTFQVKNMSTGPIARLTIEEFWWDKARNPVTGDKQFLKKPLMPGEVATIVLHTPRNKNMDSNSYKFSHQNGDVKVKKVTKF
jgi:hypothetical protein